MGHQPLVILQQCQQQMCLLDLLVAMLYSQALGRLYGGYRFLRELI